MTNAQIAQLKGWKARASALIKSKILLQKERIIALEAVEGVTFPLHQAMGKTVDEIKIMFVKKVVNAVGNALNSDKYNTVIATSLKL